MAKQKTQERVPEYLQTILADLEENDHFLGFVDEEWVIRTPNRQLVTSAPSLEGLAESVQELAGDEEEIDWLEEAEEVDELDEVELEDDEEEESWSEVG